VYLDIAICDDNEKDRGILETLLHSICSEWNLTARILHYSSGEEFLSAQAPPIDIIFMDIYRGGINGVEAARDISRAGRGRFIFTTASREYALEAFALNAAHYLLKPLTKNAVREALGRCLPKREDEHPKLLEIKTRQGIVSIPMENIVYIEVLNKICTVHTEKNSFQTYISLDALSELLDGTSFIRAQYDRFTIICGLFAAACPVYVFVSVSVSEASSLFQAEDISVCCVPWNRAEKHCGYLGKISRRGGIYA